MSLTLADMDKYTLSELNHFELCELNKMSATELALKVQKRIEEVRKTVDTEAEIPLDYRQIVINIYNTYNTIEPQKEKLTLKKITFAIFLGALGGIGKMAGQDLYASHSEEIFEALKAGYELLCKIAQ